MLFNIQLSVLVALLLAFNPIGVQRASRVSAAETTVPSSPNIVFFFIDDLGWADVGYQGSDFYRTPNIDALAASGLVFTDAYANAPNCAPSRACLLSGQYSPRHGILAETSLSLA